MRTESLASVPPFAEALTVGNPRAFVSGAMQRAMERVQKLIDKGEHLIIVSGGAGLGKTHLLRALEAEAAQAGLDSCYLDRASRMNAAHVSGCDLLLVDEGQDMDAAARARVAARTSLARKPTVIAAADPLKVALPCSLEDLPLIDIQPLDSEDVRRFAKSLSPEASALTYEAEEAIKERAEGVPRLVRLLVRGAGMEAALDGRRQVEPRDVHAAADQMVALAEPAPSGSEDPAVKEPVRREERPAAEPIRLRVVEPAQTDHAAGAEPLPPAAQSLPQQEQPRFATPARSGDRRFPPQRRKAAGIAALAAAVVAAGLAIWPVQEELAVAPAAAPEAAAPSAGDVALAPPPPASSDGDADLEQPRESSAGLRAPSPARRSAPAPQAEVVETAPADAVPDRPPVTRRVRRPAAAPPETRAEVLVQQAEATRAAPSLPGAAADAPTPQRSAARAPVMDVLPRRSISAPPPPEPVPAPVLQPEPQADLDAGETDRAVAATREARDRLRAVRN